MKRLLFISMLLLAMMPVQLAAQVNPQKGYIITNDNDTVYGTIDYLTDARNVKACLFQKNGEQGYRSLSPSDIKGYRLAGDGIYYVSRLFNGDERQELMFAEFLLQGGVSLYRYYYDNYNYFGFVDNEGKEIIIRDDKLNDDLSTYNHKLKERRLKVQEVNALMNKDNTIANRLWKMELTSSALTELVKRYDEEYCTEAGDCIVFQYDKKKTTTVLHRFYVGAGITYASYASPSYDYNVVNDTRYAEYSYSGVAPTFLVGADLHFPRFSRNLNAQVELSYTPYRLESSKVNREGVHPKMSVNEWAGRIGLSHVFSPDRRITPFVKGGLLFSGNMGMKEKNVEYKHRQGDNGQVTEGVLDMDHGNGMKVGIYLGAGVDISCIRISASWKNAWGGKEGLKEKSSGILTIAYLF